MMTEYRFKMTIMLLMGLLMGAAHGNVCQTRKQTSALALMVSNEQ